MLRPGVSAVSTPRGRAGTLLYPGTFRPSSAVSGGS
jgi:hypothetical protein